MGIETIGQKHRQNLYPTPIHPHFHMQLQSELIGITRMQMQILWLTLAALSCICSAVSTGHKLVLSRRK
jgi:hypothetical protein